MSCRQDSRSVLSDPLSGNAGMSEGSAVLTDRQDQLLTSAVDADLSALCLSHSKPGRQPAAESEWCSCTGPSSSQKCIGLCDFTAQLAP